MNVDALWTYGKYELPPLSLTFSARKITAEEHLDFMQQIDVIIL